jgi:Bacterial transcriptional regulator
LGRPTRYAVVEPGRLLADLEQTVQRGYAVTREEMTLGTCSVAAPVLDCAGRPAAAVAVVVDTVRVEPAKLTPPVRLAARGSPPACTRAIWPTVSHRSAATGRPTAADRATSSSHRCR